MKQNFLILFLTFFLISGNINCAIASDNEDIETMLVIFESTDGDPDSEEEPETPVIIPDKKGRAPGVVINCNISLKDGLRISGIDNSLIESFEIRDVYGNTIAVLTDETSFIDIVFSLHGEYRIIFNLNDRTLSGWINV